MNRPMLGSVTNDRVGGQRLAGTDAGGRHATKASWRRWHQTKPCGINRHEPSSRPKEREDRRMESALLLK